MYLEPSALRDFQDPGPSRVSNISRKVLRPIRMLPSHSWFIQPLLFRGILSVFTLGVPFLFGAVKLVYYIWSGLGITINVEAV